MNLYLEIAYPLLAVLITLVYLGIGGYALRYRSVPGSTALAIISLAAAAYAVPYIFQLDSPNLQIALFWYAVSLPGASILGPAWLVFSLEYSRQREVLNRRLVLLLGIIPLLACLAAWTNPLHNLYGTNFSFNPQAPWPVLEWDFGIFYWLNFAYAYLTMAIGTVILLRTSVNRFRFFTNQTILLVAGTIIPIVVNVLFVVGFTPIPRMDLTPFLFLVTAGAWSLAIFRYQLLDIVPVAHERVFQTMPVGVVVLNNEEKVVDINPVALKMMALPPGEVIGNKLPPVFTVSFLDSAAPSGQQEMSKEIFHEHENKPCYLDLHQTLFYDRRNRLYGSILLMHDITLRKQAELAEHEQRVLTEVLRDMALEITRTLKLDEVLDHILYSLDKIVPNDAAHVVLLNPADQSILLCRWKGTYTVGPGQLDTTNPEQPKWICSAALLDQMRLHPLPALISNQEMLTGCAACRGREWVQSTITMPVVILGQLAALAVIDSAEPNGFTEDHLLRLGLLANQAAVAIDNALLFAEVQERALRDELTGALNRRGLMDTARFEFKRAKRYQRPLGVIMFDIDNFKQVNDTYGHSAGDLVLRTVARQCLANIREIDILGRYGGDEFVVLLPECSQENIATLVAERLRACIENYAVNIGGGQVKVTISLGITISSPEEKELEEVFRDADWALYAAKEAGKNQVKISQKSTELT